MTVYNYLKFFFIVRHNCLHRREDLVFLIGSSRSVRASNPSDGAFDNWNRMLSAPINIIQRLYTGNFQFGTITFSEYVTFDITLNGNQTNEYLKNKIRKTTYRSGPVTNLAFALQFLQDRVYIPASEGRNNVPDIALLIMDHGSMITDDAIRWANIAKAQGISLLVLGNY